MACLEFVANNVKEVVQQTVEFITDPANFDPGMEWQLIRPASIADFMNAPYDAKTGKGGELILKAVEIGRAHV